MVAWKETALGFEKRDVQLLHLALVSVFEKTWTICRGFAGAMLPQSGQRNDEVIGAMKTHTFLPLGMMLERRPAAEFSTDRRTARMGAIASRRIRNEITATVDSRFDLETILEDEDVLLSFPPIYLRSLTAICQRSLQSLPSLFSPICPCIISARNNAPVSFQGSHAVSH